MMPYVFIVLSAVCSLAIAHLLKITENRRMRRIAVLTANYFFAAVIALATGWHQQPQQVSPDIISWAVIIFAVVTGAFFIGNFIVYSKSVQANGIGVSVASMRLSLLIPVLVSVIFYGELLTPLKIAGIILVFGALFMLMPSKKLFKKEQVGVGWLLVSIFVLSGFADASLKIYQQQFSFQLNELLFMGIVFGVSFLIGIVFMLKKGSLTFSRKEVWMGLLIGIPNLYSAIFLMYALGNIKGAVAFPLVNVLNVTGGTLLGLVYWKDKVSLRQWAGLLLALLSILILL